MHAYSVLADGTILRSDGACIPAHTENRDYRDFLAWKAAGNTPQNIAARVPSIEEQREAECQKAGVTDQAKLDALWKLATENDRTAVDALQDKITDVNGRIK